MSAVMETMEKRCWPWTGHTNGDGYGRVGVGGKTVAVHRAAYAALVGPIPPGLVLDHLCRNKACYNPAHLDPVTHAENVRRGMSGPRQKAKTHCPRGHPYDEENTYHALGRRHCRECRRVAVRAHRAKTKEGASWRL